MLLTTLALALAAVVEGPSEWYEPFPPHKVIGNVYYVGSKDLSTMSCLTPSTRLKPMAWVSWKVFVSGTDTLLVTVLATSCLGRMSMSIQLAGAVVTAA